MDAWLGQYCINVTDLEAVTPMWLEQWDTTMSFVLDPDGYQVEIITLARDRKA